MRPQRAPIIPSILLVALAACWNGGQGNQVTSLDGKTVIGALDDAQFQRLCHDIDGWNQAEFGSEKFRATLCEIETAASLRAHDPSPVTGVEACREKARQCERTRQGTPNIPRQCGRGPERCALTVAHVERCLFDLSYDMNTVLCTAPVCGDLCGIVDARAVNPPACAAIEDACPGLRFTRPSFEWLVDLEPCASSGPITTVCVWQ
jgi:hypothetical protein